MILSMTGYGKAEGSMDDLEVSVEIRSLNSKYLDLKIRLPQNIKDKELPIRKLISELVSRGKVDVSIEFNGLKDGSYSLNKDLFKLYFDELSSINNQLGIDQGDMMLSILKFPNVIEPDDQNITDEQYELLISVLKNCFERFNEFRKTEGRSIENDLKDRTNNILRVLSQLNPYETERVDQIRKRLKSLLDQYLSKDQIDENRFEQELLFYLEKIDINEEKVRLQQHCEYFLEQMDKNDASIGKKLNFISQEMGREINTMGAKAYSAAIQKLVIMMKDELEKIKEQVANVV